jgi:hypothetical protein
MRSSHSMGICLFAAALLVPAAGLAQSYGLGDQVLTVGAASFHEEQLTNTFGGIDFDGYLYTSAPGTAAFVAGLDLPDGAQITAMCFDTEQVLPESTLHARIQAIKLPGPGEDFGIYEVPGAAVDAQAAPGYAHTCTTDPISYTVRESADLDGGGVRHLAHRIYLSIDPDTAFGAVRITWHRQVSPAPGSPTFADVPVSDAAFPFIEALVASGVTSGCGAGNYCPDATLTRRQMAVFLAKALGLHWPN